MNGLLSQLAHLELESPRLDETVAFFTDVFGMHETERDGGRVYLRAWGDPFHHSLVVAEGEQAQLGHVGWRAAGTEQLEAAVSRLEELGYGEGWIEGDRGHGPAYRYRTPGGHLQEVFWQVERFKAQPELRSTFPVRVQKFSPVGVGVRQIDHVTVTTPAMNADIDFYRDVLGFRFMEYTVLEPASQEPFFAQLSNTEQAHDLALISDNSGMPARSHHFAYWVDQTHEVARAADILMEAGVALEYGPGKHGHGENSFLYVREPSGHRVEVFSGGYRNYQPDWEPVRWVADEGGFDMHRNWPAPDSLLKAFPSRDAPAAAVVDADVNPWALPGVS